MRVWNYDPYSVVAVAVAAVDLVVQSDQSLVVSQYWHSVQFVLVVSGYCCYYWCCCCRGEDGPGRIVVQKALLVR